MKKVKRSFLRLVSALTLGLAMLGSPVGPVALAAAPIVQTQGPGYYRTMIGDYEVTALLDGTHAFPVDTVVEGMPKDQMHEYLEQDFLKLPVQGSINAFLVNTGSKLVLIDAGAGSLYGDCCGRLIEHLRAAGYRPEQVDEIYLTHMHMDHIGGVSANGKALFPNAVLHANRVEAGYWLNAENKAKAPAFLAPFFDDAVAAVAPYQAAHRFQTFAGDTEVVPGITAIQTPGHTPGHVSYVVKRNGQTLIVWGDIVHVAALQLREPEITVKYDSDAGAAKQARKRVFDDAVRDRTMIAAAHIAFPGLGHLRRSGERFEWVPLNYEGDVGQDVGK
ncbi:MBL fold metallo-hydrolase [Burkholderia sp. SRS-W-2-2016]|uniref:MBL fold metallo-hydrolase n=1 Tax=Burkholderia sp. SRS-W-2-2016 TaxID=1926878 RepID=UPI00094B0817|nr:MBL fold metallo-hydrolase [Burkholderia sp. SRS-W-2-2016]OLL28205.1 MBL fold metallo-hydrolase [Burkholderia sp. SRS-W-2-2016]